MAKKTNIPLVLGLVIGMPVLFGLAAWGFAYSEDKENQRITEFGVPGTATVLSYEKTSVYVNNNPRLVFQLEVTSPNRPPFRVEKTLIVEPMEAPRLQVGVKRKIRYVPDEPEVLRFED